MLTMNAPMFLFVQVDAVNQTLKINEMGFSSPVSDGAVATHMQYQVATIV